MPLVSASVVLSALNCPRMKVQIYGNQVSPLYRAAILVAEAVGADYEAPEMEPWDHMSEWYKKASFVRI